VNLLDDGVVDTFGSVDATRLGAVSHCRRFSARLCASALTTASFALALLPSNVGMFAIRKPNSLSILGCGIYDNRHPIGIRLTAIPQMDRENLLEAMRLLGLAGYAVREFKLVNISSGEPLSVEFLLPAPTSKRFVLVYQELLERLGIDVTVRVVDDEQYDNRLRNWEFEIVVASWEESLTSGNEQSDSWGSRAANTPDPRISSV
jgi:hypothetical protein